MQIFFEELTFFEKIGTSPYLSGSILESTSHSGIGYFGNMMHKIRCINTVTFEIGCCFNMIVENGIVITTGKILRHMRTSVALESVC